MLKWFKSLFKKEEPETCKWINSVYINGINVANDPNPEDFSLHGRYYGSE